MKHYLASDNLTDLEQRQLQLILDEMKGNQLPEEVIEDIANRSSELNYLFNTYTPEVEGKKYSANDIREVLLNSKDLALRKKVWYASKEVGRVVEKGLLELVKKRNEAAQLLGHDNHHQKSASFKWTRQG